MFAVGHYLARALSRFDSYGATVLKNIELQFEGQTMLKVLLTSAICVAAMIPVAAYAENCHVDNYNFIFGTDASAHMTVKSGKPCGTNIKSNGMTSLAIAQQPQNGRAMTPTPVRWEYHPNPGFSGKDAFVVQIAGSSMSGKRGTVHSGNTNLNVDVDVVP